jgi:hypothetical protein
VNGVNWSSSPARVNNVDLKLDDDKREYGALARGWLKKLGQGCD